MIIYFTGTGNSRYVAEMLADLMQDQVISANEYTRNENIGHFNSDKPFVFVSPVYVSAPPIVFLKFLENSHFSGNRKAYFIQTCAGGMGASPAYTERLCRKKELEYMGTAQLVMPQNYLIYFKMRSQTEITEIMSAADDRIITLAALIVETKRFPPNDMKKWEYISTQMVIGLYYKLFITAKKFSVSDICVGCGKCERACPLDNIELHSGKPVWSDHCTHCMACINICPMQAIEYGKQTIGKPRYYCRRYVPCTEQESDS